MLRTWRGTELERKRMMLKALALAPAPVIYTDFRSNIQEYGMLAEVVLEKSAFIMERFLTTAITSGGA